MSRVRPLSALPGLAAGLLLVFALLGATDPRTRQHPVPAHLYYPTCTDMLESAGWDNTLLVGHYDGVVQPFETQGNIGACSLAVSVSTAGLAISQVQAWDPVALVGDPTTVALRQTTAYVSSGTGWTGKESYVPPVIVQSLPTVAEAQRTTIAWSFDNQSTYNFAFHWAADAPASMPTGRHWQNHGAPEPLVGSHPVLAHAVCGGDQALQSLYIAQSVVRCDSAYGNDRSVVVQRFRVPQRVQLYWLELAFHVVLPTQPGYGTIAVLDGQGQSAPPATMASALCSAVFDHQPDVAAWDSHLDFDHSIELQPNHDYWLWVSTIQDYSLYVRHRTATESVPFRSGIGELWSQNAASATWIPDPGNALDFKVIGLPLDVTSVPPPPRSSSTLRLRAGPNPAHGASMLAWSGARGALRIEVLDARGRRVAGGTANGAAGQWLFRGARDDGQPLPAGVYFVRATDGAGQAAVGRVVLVR